MYSVNYPTFVPEHLYVHHRWAATPRDPSSAQFGVSIYRYLPVALIHGIVAVYRAELDRLERSNYQNKWLNNSIIHILFFQLLLNICLLTLLGPETYLFFLCSSLISISCIQVTNYLQHYGLERKQTSKGRYEKMQPHFAWHSYGSGSQYLMINMQRHGDHHSNPKKPYQNLEYLAGLPELPYSNPWMYLMAWYPPLWFKIMNPLVEEVRQSHYYQDT